MILLISLFINFHIYPESRALMKQWTSRRSLSYICRVQGTELLLIRALLVE